MSAAIQKLNRQRAKSAKLTFRGEAFKQKPSGAGKGTHAGRMAALATEPEEVFERRHALTHQRDTNRADLKLRKF